MTTLSTRLREALQGPPERSPSELARACAVKPPSVSAWLSGKTKQLEGANLLAAAAFLEVNPIWLATGAGKMHAPFHLVPSRGERISADKSIEPEALTDHQRRLLSLFDGLTKRQQDDVINMLETRVAENDALEVELQHRGGLHRVNVADVPASSLGRSLGKSRDASGAPKKNVNNR
jgi:hypothetical protein